MARKNSKGEKIEDKKTKKKIPQKRKEIQVKKLAGKNSKKKFKGKNVWKE